MDSVNDFLVSYLDAIAERPLAYLDDEGELKVEVVKRLRFYTTALLDGSLTPTTLWRTAHAPDGRSHPTSVGASDSLPDPDSEVTTSEDCSTDVGATRVAPQRRTAEVGCSPARRIGRDLW
jgi:hypothetical protein